MRTIAAVYVEGGCVQETAEPRGCETVVVDADNLKAEGKTRRQIAEIWEQACAAAAKDPEVLQRERNIGSTAALIAEGVYGNRERYQAFYDRMGPQLSGFPGIAALIGDLAREVTDREQEIEDIWTDHDWITVCGHLSEAVSALSSAPDPVRIAAMVQEALDASKVDWSQQK